jgi:hypothetical protein
MNLDPQQDQGYPRTKRSSGSVGNAVESGWKNKKSMSGSITSMMNKPKESMPPELGKKVALWKRLGVPAKPRLSEYERQTKNTANKDKI